MNSFIGKFCLVVLFITKMVGSTVDIEFLYLGEINRDNGNISYSESVNDKGEVYPYSSIKIIFDHALSDVEKANFQNNFRLKEYKYGIRRGRYYYAGKVQVKHIHEEVSSIDSASSFGSFHWISRNELLYTASQLKPGLEYDIIYPNGYIGMNKFETASLNSKKMQILDFYCKDLECYETFVLGVNNDLFLGKEYNVALFDRRIHTKTYNSSYTTYDNINMNTRGYQSGSSDKKSFTVKFDSDNLFRGFKDSEGYQGGRKKIVLKGRQYILSNKLFYDTARHLENRIMGGNLAPDSYFTIVNLNGKFHGIYNITEHLHTGKGGWSMMKSRMNNFGFNSKGKGMLHKLTNHDFIALENDSTDYLIKPMTNHELDFTQDGSYWNLNMDYNIFAYYDIFNINNCMSHIELKFKDPKEKIDFEGVEFDCTFYSSDKGDFFGISSIATNKPYGPIDFLVADIDNELHSTEISFQSNELNTHNRRVELEFRTSFDFQQFINRFNFSPSAQTAMDWFDINSALISNFVAVITFSPDNFLNNQFFFSKEKDLENFRNAIEAPNNKKYYTIVWDGDLAFLRHDDYMGNIRLSHIEHLANSEEIKQRYVNLFSQEKQTGGVLTYEFYRNKLNEYIKNIGAGYEFEQARWSANRLVPINSLDKSIITNYINKIKNFNEDELNNNFLSIVPNDYIRPNNIKQLDWYNKKFSNNDLMNNAMTISNSNESKLCSFIIGDNYYIGYEKYTKGYNNSINVTNKCQGINVLGSKSNRKSSVKYNILSSSNGYNKYQWKFTNGRNLKRDENIDSYLTFGNDIVCKSSDRSAFGFISDGFCKVPGLTKNRKIGFYSAFYVLDVQP